MQDASIRLFVYGTLLFGEENHGHLRGAERLGSARTRPAFRLVDLGSFPALVRGGGAAVSGEVYAIDLETLAGLDELEDHPDLYQRAEIPLEGGIMAYAYLLDEAKAGGHPVIASGDWRRR